MGSLGCLLLLQPCTEKKGPQPEVLIVLVRDA